MHGSSRGIYTVAVMGLSKEQIGQQAERRQKVAGLYLRRIQPFVIARTLNHRYETIKRDIAWLEAQWHKELVDDPIAIIRRELASLDDIERDCAMQFSGSLHPKWLTIRLQCQERRAKVLGLDAAQKLEHSGKDGGPIQVDVAAIEAKIRALGQSDAD